MYVFPLIPVAILVNTKRPVFLFPTSRLTVFFPTDVPPIGSMISLGDFSFLFAGQSQVVDIWLFTRPRRFCFPLAQIVVFFPLVKILTLVLLTILQRLSPPQDKIVSHLTYLNENNRCLPRTRSHVGEDRGESMRGRSFPSDLKYFKKGSSFL